MAETTMFPDAPQSEHDELVDITWDAFFEEFDKRNLALLHDPACSTRSSAETPPSGAPGASTTRRAIRCAEAARLSAE
jgi:hypothetical protein